MVGKEGALEGGLRGGGEEGKLRKDGQKDNDVISTAYIYI